MKRWIPALLLPLVLLQSPGFAQTESPLEADEPSPTEEDILPTIAPGTEPTLIPLEKTEQVHLQLVNCSWWLDCALARLLLPASETIGQRNLFFENPAPSPVEILNTAVVVYGDFTGYQLSNEAIALPQDIQSLPANQIVSLPLLLNRSEMPPDQYSGRIYLTLQGLGDRLILPITFNVRSGPLLPLLVLFLGVILGRLFKYMQERGEPQAKALKEVYRLQNDIARSKLDEQEKQLLTEMVAEVRTLVVREQLDAAPAQIQAIRDRLDLLLKLEALENEFVEKADSFPVNIDEFAERIHKVRWLIAQRNSEDDARAKELLETLSLELDSIGSRSAGDPVIEDSKRSLDKIRIESDRVTQPSKASDSESGRLSNVQQFLVTLSGVSDHVRAEATLWVVRPLLSLALLIGLLAVGIDSLYVESGTTFGARRSADYLGLLLWGLSADVASRSLSSLQGQRE